MHDPHAALSPCTLPGRSGSRALAGFCLLLALAGCTPSAQQLVKDRAEIDDPEAAVEAQVALLELFQRPRLPGAEPPPQTLEPVWRVEAVRTLVALDRRFDFAAARPDLHAAVRRALREECASPPGPDPATVRAWSVHGLGQLSGTPELEPFVAALEATGLPEDPRYLLAQAALGALAPRLDALAADAALRGRALQRLAELSAALRAGQVEPRQARRLEPLLEYARAHLAGEAAVVALLPEDASAAIAPAAVRELLRWDYEQLARAGDPPASAAPSAENLRRLRGLAWHDDAGVRQWARSILWTFAPGELLAALAERFEAGRPIDEDFVHVANLLTAPGPLPAAVRQRALDAALEQGPLASPEAREVLYARVAESEPALLAGALARRTGLVIDQPAPAVRQHVRYLVHLLGHPQVHAQGPGARDALAAALAEAYAAPDPVVRGQVTEALLPDDPGLLARAAGAAVIGTPPEDAAAIRGPLADYLAALERIEALPRGAAALADPPGPLVHALGSPNPTVKSAAGRCLAARDPSLLIAALAPVRPGPVEARLAEVVLLAEALASPAGLDPTARGRGLAALADRLSTEEEVGLLAARYLVALGAAPPPGPEMAPAVRAVLGLAAGEEVQP